jgi:parallel beta-helix repeat protein
MTVVSQQALRTRALQVMNETAGFANSEVRVGSLLRDMIDSGAPGNTPSGLIPTLSDAATMTANTATLEPLLVSDSRITLPVGTFYLAEGSLLATVCIQIGSSISNLTIEGQGEGITVLKLGSGENSHVINIDGATNIKIRNLTVDGNRDNNTSTSWHGIRTGSSGVTGLAIQNVTVKQTRGYGLGLQGGDKKRLRLVNVTTEDTGADGCDFKNTSDNSEDIVIVGYSARRWGLDGTLTEQAGIDCRGPCKLFGIWCSEGPADGHYIRFREGEVADASLGGHYSTLSGFVCEGNSGATSIGVYVPAHDCDISGGYVSDCLLGVLLHGERNTTHGITVNSCDDESFQVNLTGENCRITDCHSLSATGSGFRIRAPRVKLTGCSSGLDTVSGIVTESTATDLQITGFDVEGTGGTMVGVDITSADVTVIGGSATGCFRGYSSAAARTKFIGVSARSNTDDGILLAVGADDSLVSGCTATSNTDDGIVLRADRCRIFANTITSNSGTGLDIIAGADNNRIDGNYFASNGTAMGDAGSGNRFGLLNDGLSSPYLNTTIVYLAGTGSPEGVHAAPVGSQFARTDGGAVTSLYIKESGTGNTGWVAK